MIRSTPWVDGCCGPMLMIIVWDSPSSSGHGPPVTTISECCGEHLRALVGLALEPLVLLVVRDALHPRTDDGGVVGLEDRTRRRRSSCRSSVVSVVSLIAGPGRP